MRRLPASARSAKGFRIEHLSDPIETAAYREARNALLYAEIALCAQAEAAASSPINVIDQVEAACSGAATAAGPGLMLGNELHVEIGRQPLLAAFLALAALLHAAKRRLGTGWRRANPRGGGMGPDE